MSPSLVVPARFNGPAASGNGGYVAGLLAALAFPDIETPITVTLRQPPPLATKMDLVKGELIGPSGVVATVSAGDAVLDPIDPVSSADASLAAKGYPGFAGHPFPTCFACGPDRNDGLRIFPGKVRPGDEADTRVAAPWTPDDSLEDLKAATWAALDCVGGWSSDIEDRPMVLGQITVTLDALPVVDEPHVVLGQELGRDGRKTFTAATLVDSDGRVVGRARHTWITVDPAAFNKLS